MVRKLIETSIFVFLFALAQLCLGSSRRPAIFNEYRLTVSGKVSAKVVDDFNQDGLKDILITEGRRASLFLQSKDSGFGAKPNQIWEFDPSVVLFDVGDISKSPGKELLCMTDDTIFYYPFRNGKVILTEKKSLIELQTIGDRLEKADICKRDFLIDLDNDGDDDLIVPGAGTYTLFRQESNRSLKPMAKIDAQISSQILVPEDDSLFRIISAFQIPKIIMGDFNGDGKRDIVLRRGNALAIFSEDEKGTLPKQPSLVLNLSKDKQGDDFAPAAQSEVEDVNNDGILDIIVTEQSSTPLNVKEKHTTGMVKLYLSSPSKAKNRNELGKPSQIIKWRDRYVIGIRLLDINNDGLDDLGVLTMKKFGLWGAIKILISRKLNFRLYIFLQHRPSSGQATHILPYPLKPDLKRDITVPFVLRRTPSEIKVGSPLLLTVEGDFNGDGRKDWVYKDKPDRLSFYFGTEKKEIFEKSAGYRKKIMDTSNYQFVTSIVDDLNADGISDLLLHYKGWGDEKDAVNVILSTLKVPKTK